MLFSPKRALLSIFSKRTKDPVLREVRWTAAVLTVRHNLRWLLLKGVQVPYATTTAGGDAVQYKAVAFFCHVWIAVAISHYFVFAICILAEFLDNWPSDKDLLSVNSIVSPQGWRLYREVVTIFISSHSNTCSELFGDLITPQSGGQTWNSLQCLHLGEIDWSAGKPQQRSKLPSHYGVYSPWPGFCLV